MALFRRARSATPPDDGGSAGEGGAEAELGPLGPTGRPLHPIGAYFEAAFRRFGVNFLGYLLYTAACGLFPLAAVLVNDSVGGAFEVGLLVFSLAFVLGHVLLLALVTGLVSGIDRDRIPAVLVTCAVTTVLGGLAVWTLRPLAILIYPLIAFPPIIAASGDAGGLRAVWDGVRTTLRWFRRAYACVLGLVVVAAAIWFGFVVLLSPLADDLQQELTLAITTLLIWPIGALVFRNLYGDVTGRLVINASPREDHYRKELLRHRRDRAKRNSRRLRRIRGGE